MASDGLTTDERDEIDALHRMGVPIICNCGKEFDLDHIDCPDGVRSHPGGCRTITLNGWEVVQVGRVDGTWDILTATKMDGTARWER